MSTTLEDIKSSFGKRPKLNQKSADECKNAEIAVIKPDDVRSISSKTTASSLAGETPSQSGVPDRVRIRQSSVY